MIYDKMNRTESEVVEPNQACSNEVLKCILKYKSILVNIGHLTVVAALENIDFSITQLLTYTVVRGS